MNMSGTMKLLMALSLAVFTIYGCGEEKETNVPATKLTASSVVSVPASDGHGHSVTIPFSDLDLASDPGFTASSDFQYRSSDNTGHSHVIALSKQQLTDLNNGLRVTVTSSVTSTHSHTWNLQGGAVLYEKFCYNCHSNDKRGNNPMNVTVSSGQRSSIINPSSAAVSTATAVVPDPNFMPVAEMSLDGAYLYAKYCAGCHDALAVKTGRQHRSSWQWVLLA